MRADNMPVNSHREDDFEDTPEKVLIKKLNSDLEQANNKITAFETKMIYHEVLGKRFDEQIIELEKANKDIQVLAEALGDCANILKLSATFYMPPHFKDKYKELANKYKDK